MISKNRDRTGLASGDKRPLAAPLLVLLFLAVSAIGLGLQRRAVTQQERYEAGVDNYRVLQIRAEMTWLHLDILISGLNAERLDTKPSANELAAFSQERAVAIAELTEIASRESVVAAQVADELLFNYNDSASNYEFGWPYDAGALDYDHYTSVDPDVPPPATQKERLVEDTLFLSALPRLVLIDALSLALDDRSEPVPEWAAQFVGYTADVVRETPGWFGPDRTDPLNDNVIITRPLPVPASSLSSYRELQQIWDYDNWLLGYFDGGPTEPTPLTIDELVEAEAAASAGLDAFVLQQIDEAMGEPSETNVLSPDQWLLVSILSGTAALIVGATLFIRRRMQHKHLADAVFTDSLTGAKNRRYLGDELQNRCDRRHTHHVVAMIDLDRFKMVNDTWGHDVGDTILIAAAERLTTVVQAVTSPWPQADGAVVRLGGDEFAVVLHSPDRFNLAALEASFRAVAGPVEVGLDMPVALELSVGLAESFEPADIHDLLKGADLAVYRDKRSEAGPTSNSAPTGPPPLSVDLR